MTVLTVPPASTTHAASRRIGAAIGAAAAAALEAATRSEAPVAEGTTVAVLLRDRLTRLGERIACDGIDAHEPAVRLLAHAVRGRSALLADVLTGRDHAVLRERAFSRAATVVQLRPADHAALALALPA